MPKFDVGDTVWFFFRDAGTTMFGAQVKCGTITQIHGGPSMFFYQLDDGSYLWETRIYETRDEAFKDAINWCAQRIGRLQEEMAQLEQLRLQAQDTQ